MAITKSLMHSKQASIVYAPLTERKMVQSTSSPPPPNEDSTQVLGSIETEPSTSQQSDQSWHWFLMVILTLIFAYIGGWLLFLLLQTVSIVTALSAQLLLSLLLLKQDSGTILGSSFILWFVFGGHRSLKVPACLRHPIDATQQQPVKNSDYKRHKAVTKAQRPVTGNTAAHLVVASTQPSGDGTVHTKATVATQIESNFAMSTTQSSFEGSTSHNLPGSCSSISSTAYEHEGSLDTPPSSELSTNSEDSNIKKAEVPSQPAPKPLVDLALLFDIVGIHGNPKFHEGPLHEVQDAAWELQLQEVNSVYNLSETSSCFTGLASFPDRPISADKDDILRMLEFVQPWLSPDLQNYLSQGDTSELDRTRNGMTGQNILAAELELLWHQHRPLIINGTAITVTDLSIIHAYQMSKTRSFRPACPPGLQGEVTRQSTHRQYLTDEQVVMINQGCIDYTEYDDAGYKCATLRKLERHTEHAGAEITNPVLDWLEGQEGVEFYDANGYLPCRCGARALADHLKSRIEVEPGYEPHAYSCAIPLYFLNKDALNEDLKRKAEHEAHFNPTAEFPRCRGLTQECDLHAIPTNNLWILADGINNLNNALTGTNNGLPIPGFTELTNYPPGFRMPQGFCEIAHELLPPRCRHGYLHPPFADHCMGCFPNGENHTDCAECTLHAAVPAILQNPCAEREYDALRADWNRAQWQRVDAGERYEQEVVVYEQKIARWTSCFQDWPPVVTV